MEEVRTKTADMSTPFLRDINTLQGEPELQVVRKITECDGKNPLGATKKYNGKERKIRNKGWEKSSRAELAEI